MGFSTSGAMAVIFVGLLVAVGIVYPVLETAHDRRADAIDDRDERALDVRNTAVNLSEANAAADRIVVENTGTTTLSVEDTDLLVDGDYESFEGTVYEASDPEAEGGDRDLWQPGEDLVIEDDVALEDGQRVKIVTENGISVATEVES